MGGLKAPASSLCSDSGCSIEAQAAALRAGCRGSEITNPQGLGTQSYPSTASHQFCSETNPLLCVTLSRNDPATFANFSTTYPAGCETDMSSECEGEWATIFGVWANAIDAPYNSTPPLHTVDCTVQFGNVTITQNGGASPVIDRDSFVKSSQTEIELGAAENAWRRIYTSEGTQSPYTFGAVQGGADGANTLYQDNTLALLLLHYADSTGADATAVARNIEANFDTGTLFAFSRSPESATITTTTTTSQSTWHYNPLFLIVLAIPILAMIAALWGRWRVGNDEDVVTYLPIDIARRGPVDYLVEGGVSEHGEPLMVKPEKRDEETLVWGVKGPESPTGERAKVRIVTSGMF